MRVYKDDSISYMVAAKCKSVKSSFIFEIELTIKLICVGEKYTHGYTLHTFSCFVCIFLFLHSLQKKKNKDEFGLHCQLLFHPKSISSMCAKTNNQFLYFSFGFYCFTFNISVFIRNTINLRLKPNKWRRHAKMFKIQK